MSTRARPQRDARPAGAAAAVVGRLAFRALAAAALLLSPLAARGQDGKPPAAPAAVPAPATAPLPGPKAVALAYLALIDKGDAPAATALLSASEPPAPWVQATIGLSAALKKLDAAAVTRFGEAGKSVSQNQLHLAEAAKAIEQAAEKIDGDDATLTLPTQAQPLRLKRVNGVWLLQLAPTGPAAQRQLALYRRLTRAATQTANEVAAGGHPTPEAAAKSFTARALEARVGS